MFTTRSAAALVMLEQDQARQTEDYERAKLDLIKKAQWNDQKKRDKDPYLVTTSYGKLVRFVIITS